MQSGEFNRATMEVANRTMISRRMTVDESNHGLRSGKEKSFGRIACSTFVGSLMLAGLLVAVPPLPTRAENGEDSRHGREDNDKGIRAEVVALQAQVASLQSTVSALQSHVNSLQASNTALKSQLAVAQSNHALLLGPFVSVDPNPEIGVIGPNIVFSGANIHIVSGSGSTFDNFNNNPTGLGNLIIGYDEDPAVRGGFPLNPGDRGGSHNLVIGTGSRFTRAAFGGLVAGELNTISNIETSVVGGGDNIASGEISSVLGGFFNRASGFESSISGGQANTSSGAWDSILGGFENTTSRNFSSVSGGVLNTANGQYSSVSGGQNNSASGTGTVVIGGLNIIDNNDNSIAPKAPYP